MIESTSSKGILGFIITSFSAWATFIPLGLQISGALLGLILLWISIQHKRMEKKYVKMMIESL